MSLQINYIDAPEGAQEKMTASSVGKNSFSTDGLLVTGGSEKIFATLEPEGWPLDGSREILPDQPGKIGWWSSSRSDGEGRFEVPPVITLTFPVPYSAAGFTFVFSPATGQFCTELYAVWYNGQTKITEGSFYPEDAVWTLNNTVEAFDRVEFRLLATNRPCQLAKIRRIEIGRTILFEGDEIISAEVVNEVDPALCVLSADTMTIEVNDSRGRNLIPQENQRMELLRDGEKLAVQYIVSSSRESESRFRIGCQSAIGLLEDTFLGGMYRNKPLAELVKEIVGGFSAEISPMFDDTVISGYLPVCSQREALQQVAFAVGAVVSTQGGDAIRLLDFPTNLSGAFDRNSVFLGGSVKTSPRVAKVTVYAHSYEPDGQETILVNGQEIMGEEVLLTFDRPHYDYRITGGEITDWGTNWITVTAEGAVTVAAKGYEHTSIAHTRRNPNAVAKEQSNFVAVSDVTILGSHNAEEALNRLYNVYQLRQTTRQNVVVNGQRAGDLVASVTPWGSQTRGFLSSMDLRLTQAGQTAGVYIQGMEVEPTGVYLYAGELFAGNEEVLY